MKPAEIKQLVADLMVEFCRRHYPRTKISGDGVKDAVKIEPANRIAIDEKGGAANLDMNDPVVVVGLSIVSSVLYDLMKSAVTRTHDLWFKKATEEVAKTKTDPYRDEELKAIARRMVEFLHDEQRAALMPVLDRLAGAPAVSPPAPPATKGPTDMMDIVEAGLGAKLKSKNAAAIDPYVVVEPADLVEACRFLRDDPRLKFECLNCITGVDYLELDPKKAPKAGFEPHLEVVYHLSSFTHKHRLVVKVILPRWKDGKPGELPEVPTLTGIWPAADWHERETFDLAGVMFTGHPDLRRILLSDDWVGHPLRKDYEFPLEYHGIRGR